jgi:hypothetical protein
LKQRLPVFQQPYVIACDRLDKGFGGRKLPEGNTEVVRIVQCIQQITVERVDVCKTREGLDGAGEAFSEGFGRVFDLSRVEGSDSANLEARADLEKGFKR